MSAHGEVGRGTGQMQRRWRARADRWKRRRVHSEAGRGESVLKGGGGIW